MERGHTVLLHDPIFPIGRFSLGVPPPKLTKADAKTVLICFETL